MPSHSLDLELSSSQYAYAADSASLSITGDLTLEAWIKLESLTGTTWVLSKKANDDNYDCYSIYLTTSTIAARFTTGTTTFEDESASFTFKTGVWYHIAITRSGTTVTFYVNGKNIGTGTQTTVTGALQDSSANFEIGRYRSADGRYFDGLIKYVRVFNDARTQNEIIADAWTEEVSDANLQAEWKLDNAYTDTSGNGNTLTASGSPTFSTNIPWEQPTGASGSTYLETNLVSWWTLDEASGTRADAHGSNDLTDNNTVGSGTGKHSNAADFERDNSESLSIANGSQSGLNLTGSWSAAFWMKPESFDGTDVPLCRMTGGLNGYFVYTSVSGGKIGMQIDSNDLEIVYTFSAGTWYHIVAVYNSTDSRMELYVNGVLVGYEDSVSAPTSNTADFKLGDGLTGHLYDGLLDEVSMYSRALHYGDILDLYANGDGIPYSGSTSITVNPSAQVVTASVPAYSVLFDKVLGVNAQIATFSLPARTLSMGASVSPSAQVATFSIPQYVIDAGGNITVAVNPQTATFSIPAYSILKDFVVAVNALTATFSTQAPTIALGTGVAVTPLAQTATFSVPAYTITLEANLVLTPAVQVLTFSLPILAKVGAVWRKIGRSTSADWTRVSRNSQ